MISLFDNTLSYRRVIMRQRAFYFIRPIALISFNHQLSCPIFLILGWAEYHLYWCPFSAIRFKFSYLGIYRKLNTWITGKVSIIFSIGFISIRKLKFNTCWLVNCCNNFEFIINKRRNEKEIASKNPFTASFSPYLKLSLHIDGFIR